MNRSLQVTHVTLAVVHTGRHAHEYLAEQIAERAWKMDSIELCDVVSPTENTISMSDVFSHVSPLKSADAPRMAVLPKQPKPFMPRIEKVSVPATPAAPSFIRVPEIELRKSCFFELRAPKEMLRRVREWVTS